MPIHSADRRRWYWAWGWEFRYGDWSPGLKGETLPFGHIWCGLFTLTKDTNEPWWRGWTFRWNRD